MVSIPVPSIVQEARTKRLVTEYQRLNHQWELRGDKIDRLREKLLYQADENVRIQLEKDIQDQEAQQQLLEEEIKETERKLGEIGQPIEGEQLPNRSPEENPVKKGKLDTFLLYMK